jgi:hypothetical protein
VSANGVMPTEVVEVDGPAPGSGLVVGRDLEAGGPLIELFTVDGRLFASSCADALVDLLDIEADRDHHEHRSMSDTGASYTAVGRPSTYTSTAVPSRSMRWSKAAPSFSATRIEAWLSGWMRWMS